MARVLDSGRFILGEEVLAFEQAFAAYLGRRHCVACGSGTDAITLALRALDVQPGDEIITPTNTCFAAVCGIREAGAKPALCEALPGSAMTGPAEVEAAITPRTRVIMPVNLYGASPDLEALGHLSERRGIPIVEDCAQSHGTKFRGKMTGTFGVMGCFSFYPSKNLGCYGDGGAVVTDDDGLDRKLRLLRNYGQEDRYAHRMFGLNSRLDEVQAAILSAKLPRLETWSARRRELAARYDAQLRDVPGVTLLGPVEGTEPAPHLYVIRVRKRKELQQALAGRGIQTFIHYPVPCHLQEACRFLGHREGDFPAAEALAREVLSLPLFPQLREEEVDHVAQAIRAFAAG